MSDCNFAWQNIEKRLISYLVLAFLMRNSWGEIIKNLRHCLLDRSDGGGAHLLEQVYLNEQMYDMHHWSSIKI